MARSIAPILPQFPVRARCAILKWSGSEATRREGMRQERVKDRAARPAYFFGRAFKVSFAAASLIRLASAALSIAN